MFPRLHISDPHPLAFLSPAASLLVTLCACAAHTPPEPGKALQSQPPVLAAPAPSREQMLASERAAAAEEALGVLCRIAARQRELLEDGHDFVSTHSPRHSVHEPAPDVDTGWIRLRLPASVRCTYRVRHTLMGVEPVAADIVDTSRTPWWYAVATCHEPSREVVLIARNDDARIYNESPTTRRQGLASPRIPDADAVNDLDYRCTDDTTWAVEPSPRP